MMDSELAHLTLEADLLAELVETMKKALGLSTRMVGMKLDEISKLTRKLNELKYGKVNKPGSLGKADEVTGNEIGIGRKDAAAIFPEEVWKIIFGSVSDPNDLWNISNTCQLFNSVIFPWKTGWMLEQALPYLYQHLPGSKLLECRLVCKSWKAAVDSFLDDHPSMRPLNPEKYDPRRLDFVNPMKEKQIMAPYELNFHHNTSMQSPGYPYNDNWKPTRVIGRVLNLRMGNIKPYGFLEEDDDEDVDGNDDDDDAEEDSMEEDPDPGFLQHWNEIYEYLRPLGKGTWYLNMRYGNKPNDIDNDAIREWERKLLPFMTADVFRIFPELRKLSIVQKEEPLEGTIDPESLPSAPNLETFESTCCGEGIGTAILTRYHNQLGCLNLTVHTWKDANPLDWPNLKELHLNLFSKVEHFYNLWDGLRLPQLTKLGMDFALIKNIEAGFQSLLRVVRELSAISPLSTLRLEGLRGLHNMQIEGSSNALSNVKTLEIEHRTFDDRAPIYDFLLHSFPLLENLNLFIREISYFSLDHCPGTDMELLPWADCIKYKKPLPLGKELEIVEVNKYMYDRAMYKSNIWELMPLLKVFSFQWDVYTRHEYALYQEKLRSKVLKQVSSA